MKYLEPDSIFMAGRKESLIRRPLDPVEREVCRQLVDAIRKTLSGPLHHIRNLTSEEREEYRLEKEAVRKMQELKP